MRPEQRHPANSPGRLDLPMSVWPVTQQVSRTQRRGRYVPDSLAHPARMLPALARHAIETFTEPGDVVVDPMCGIGTSLVEAVHLGRHAVGVELETRWADLAAANLTHARTHGATGRAEVFRADARHLPATLVDRYAGRAALVLTSPPYGPNAHGRVRATGDNPVTTWNKTYGSSRRRNLAHQRLHDLLAGLTTILTGCARLLRPGGVVVITARPWRRHDELVDLPGAVLQAGINAGLHPVQRCVALLAGIRDGRLVSRASFFQLLDARRLIAEGVPAYVVAHEDVLVLTRAAGPAGRRRPGTHPDSDRRSR
jgi:modification methylase